MSSTYRILCLDHDPALMLDRDYPSAPTAEADLLDGIEEHATCDLMIGRYSAPLVELGCPRWRQGQPSPCHHSGTEWADVEWLRLLALAQQEPEGSSVHAAASAFGLRCWSPRRLHRLSAELGVPITDRLTALLPPDLRAAGVHFAWAAPKKVPVVRFACPTGRHGAHGGDTCEEYEQAATFLHDFLYYAFATGDADPIPETLRGPNWPADNAPKEA